MSNVLITNKKFPDKCITQHADDNDWNAWDGYQMRPCDPGFRSQNVSFNKKNDYYQIQTNAAEMFISRQNLALHGDPYDVRHAHANDNNNIDGKRNRFDIIGTGKNNGKSGLEAINSGAFTFGSKDYNTYKIDAGNDQHPDVIRNFIKDDGRDEQVWIKHELLQKCKERGISFDDCVVSELDKCDYQYNKDRFDKCPRDYCLRENNVTKPECKTWCVENPGACDDTVLKYCRANPDEVEYCGCINIQKYEPTMRQLANKGSTMLPSCHIDQCVKASAYKTQNLKDIQCPTQQICIQGVDIDAQKSELTNVNFECELTNNGNGDENGIDGNTSNSTATNDNIKTFLDNPQNILIIAGISVGIILMIFLTTR